MIWTETSRADAERDLRAAFAQFWRDVVVPAQRAAGGRQRRRPLAEAQRDARATVLAARLRTTEGLRGDRLAEAVVRELRRRWPTYQRTPLEADSLLRAVGRFRRRLAQEPDA